MTRTELIERKIGNQKRKLKILDRAKSAPRQARGYWANFPHIQNGKYSAIAKAEGRI